MADSWGTERAGETNVPCILAHWLNTRPPESSHWSETSPTYIYSINLVVLTTQISSGTSVDLAVQVRYNGRS
ncbi:hypothetical protein DFR62_1017 [Planococcus citreus]|uniref:Uncharacterized protein n=1 Tax=Planococcus citreus TaxID=1373 RepID=A0A497YVD9_9BACL|nr:hypothetical protein DFR62_1017 [Planococcus citreus]